MAFPSNYMGYYPNQNYYQPNPVPDMLNQYKMQYQPQIQPMPMQQPQNQPTQMNQPSNDIIWVQGAEGAKAYLVAPNSTVVLWDSENPTIYLKSADSSGMPSTRILDWVERSNNPPNPLSNENKDLDNKYVRLEEFNALKTEMEAISKELDSINMKSKQKIVKTKEDSVNA